MQKMKQDTLHYLEEEEAYHIKDEVAEIKVYWASMKEGAYTSAVVFADEIDVIYFYAYKPGTKQIQQVDAEYVEGAKSKGTFKHIERSRK